MYIKVHSLGFTGSSSEGIPTLAQIVKAEEILFHMQPANVHHGDCINADAWFHAWATGPRKYRPFVHVHPPDKDTFRAGCIGNVNHVPKPYMKRNDDIVKASNALLAMPHGPEEVRSGTWATIRRARKKGIPIFIVYPNGKLETE